MLRGVTVHVAHQRIVEGQPEACGRGRCSTEQVVAERRTNPCTPRPDERRWWPVGERSHPRRHRCRTRRRRGASRHAGPRHRWATRRARSVVAGVERRAPRHREHRGRATAVHLQRTELRRTELVATRHEPTAAVGGDVVARRVHRRARQREQSLGPKAAMLSATMEFFDVNGAWLPSRPPPSRTGESWRSHGRVEQSSIGEAGVDAQVVDAAAEGARVVLRHGGVGHHQIAVLVEDATAGATQVAAGDESGTGNPSRSRCCRTPPTAGCSCNAPNWFPGRKSLLYSPPP